MILWKNEESSRFVDVYLTGEIIGGEDNAAMAVALSVDENKPVMVHVDSVGGDVSAGLAMYNLLKGYQSGVCTIVEGFACSAASLVFMAGEERIMQESSLLMIHNAWMQVTGNADALRSAAESLEKIGQSVRKVYQSSVTITEEELQALLDNETWLTPEDAIGYGFATAIGIEGERGVACASAFAAIKAAVCKAPTQPSTNPVDEPEDNWFFKNFN